jgi:ribosomal protein S18 acetylase RimI-like enzyme
VVSLETATIVREARDSDREALGRYGAALMRQHHAFDPERFITVAKPESGYGHFLESQIRETDSLVLVAEHDSKVVGYIFASLEPTSWKDLRAACGYIHDVFVDESMRGHRIGETLMLAALKWLASKNVPRTVLSSAAKNEGAQRLFERMGFRRTMIEMTRETQTPAS